jgi:phospholipid/cholesterol/gamma-HCH transport system substrate-binding protein
MDDLLHKFGNIANNVESITDSFNGVVGGARGERQLHEIFDNINATAQSLAAFAAVLERSFVKNEDNLDMVMRLGEEIKRVADRLDDKVLPAFQESIEKISAVFERDFDNVTHNLSKTARALEEASLQARDGFSSLTSVTEKIDEGKGLIGKLINEDETYRDLKVAISGLKNYFSQVSMLEVVFDAHGETMYRPAENYYWEDSKFFLDMRIHPNEDHFYLLQFAASERGYIDRKELRFDYAPPQADSLLSEPVDTATLSLADGDRVNWTFNRQETTINRYAMRVGIQFGKVFSNLAFRIGLFEGFGGLALDVDVPLGTEKFRWLTTLEVYDMTGFNRIKDRRRPHIKWLNKMYFMRNIYFAFGADDFVSNSNASAFFGAGIRFGDEDIKYLLPNLSGASGLVK